MSRFVNHKSILSVVVALTLVVAFACFRRNKVRCRKQQPDLPQAWQEPPGISRNADVVLRTTNK
jgi:hypothetical protein